MNQDIFTMIIEAALTGVIAVISYFLKRTISELDDCKHEISAVKETYVSRAELNDCKIDIAKIKEDYITKEDFFREQTENRRKLDRIMDILLEIKGDSGK